MLRLEVMCLLQMIDWLIIDLISDVWPDSFTIVCMWVCVLDNHLSTCEIIEIYMHVLLDFQIN